MMDNARSATGPQPGEHSPRVSGTSLLGTPMSVVLRGAALGHAGYHYCQRCPVSIPISRALCHFCSRRLYGNLGPINCPLCGGIINEPNHFDKHVSATR
jgi:hypothetical protein